MYTLKMPLGLIGLTLAIPSLAQQNIIDEVVQGGISVDTSGISTPTVAYVNNGTWYEGDELQVQIPDGATITKVYAVV